MQKLREYVAELKKNVAALAAAESSAEKARIQKLLTRWGDPHTSPFFHHADEILRNLGERIKDDEKREKIASLAEEVRLMCHEKGDLVCHAAYRDMIGRCNRDEGVFTLKILDEGQADEKFAYWKKFGVSCDADQAWVILECFIRSKSELTDLGVDPGVGRAFKGTPDLEELARHIIPTSKGRGHKRYYLSMQPKPSEKMKGNRYPS